MMTPKKQNLLIGCIVILLFVALSWMSFDFMDSVQTSLWDNSVKNIMESTARGASALQRSYTKNLEMLRLLADELGQGNSSDKEKVLSRLKILFASSTEGFSALVFADGTGYMGNGLPVTLAPEEVYFLRALNKQSGLILPHRNRGTGRRVFTIYVAFTFSDGQKAYLFKSYNVESLYLEYALTFYNNTGFSYVVTQDGDIVMRSPHPASNKTSASLFDIISWNGNDPEVVRSFRSSLGNGKTGMAVFKDKNGENLFCYVPMPEMDGWYIVSIVPNREIMREADFITRKTLFICFLVFAGFLVVFLVYLHMNQGYQKEIRNLAYTDQLTGIRNFTKFRIDSEALLNAPDTPNYAALSTDMLNFKIFNSVMGYAAGNVLLRAFAQMLENETKQSVICARVVSDKFFVLFPYQDKSELLEYCNSLGMALLRFMESSCRNYRMELRIGICCIEDCDVVPEINALIDRANIALKAIKTKGALPYNFYDHTMRDKLLREKELEMRMEKSLQSGDFIVYFQPKYRLDTKCLAGGEALVRWETPDQGLLSPGEFIPLFERNRFIAKLDQFIFTAVCAFLRQWLDAGLNPQPVSVNVSRVQFYMPDFEKHYIQIKEQYNVPDGLLELEFTESIFFENVELLNATMHTLKHAGFHCSIDDFGTGYSSLNLLKDLPADTLKLDGAFFHTAKDDNRAKTVIRNIIRMAREMNMITVAEGVETWEQVEFLETAGCDMVQGYVFGRPMAAEDFAKLFSKGESGSAVFRANQNVF